jgi:hypothetical protein
MILAEQHHRMAEVGEGEERRGEQNVDIEDNTEKAKAAMVMMAMRWIPTGC